MARKEDAYTMQAANVLEPGYFVESRAALEETIEELQSQKAMRMTHAELEVVIEQQGREIMRRLLQDHLDLRSGQEVRMQMVVGADGVERTHVRPRSRELETVFGTVEVDRLAYGARERCSLIPLDAALNLPEERYSHGLRRIAAIEASKGSFDEAVDCLQRTTGAEVAKRQVEELVRRAGADFDSFYEKAEIEAPIGGGELLVISVDGKGIVVRRQDLRPATRKAAEKSQHKLKKKLSKGEKRHRKRRAMVATVYDVEPHVRRPQDVIADDPQKKEQRRRAPRAKNKRVWASVSKPMEQVIEEAFQEALRRDPEKKRRWVVLVDGDEEQLKLVQQAARRHAVRVTIVLDVIHVLQYLWKAGLCFHGEGTAELEEWVTERLLRVLQGKAGDVAAGMRRSATLRGLKKARREPVDTCAGYLLKNKGFLRYDRALRRGYPIGTGVIEGACRHLVKDRMELTGARWSLRGAEAVLRLRAIRSSGDFEAYWRYHLMREHDRVHAIRYASRKIAAVRPALRVIRGGASS
jgi:hypothetical protein